MKLFVILIVLALIFSAAPLASAEPISLTLDQALGIALRDNRDILLKEEELKKAKAKLDEANAELFPSLEFSATRKITRGLYAKDIPQTNTQTTLKQYLYKGGKTINTIKYNQYGIVISKAQLDRARLETALNVRKAFYALLLAEELVLLNRAILDNTKAHLEILTLRYQQGQASRSDLLKIEQSLSSVNKVYESSLLQLALVEELLKNLLYLEQKAKIGPQGAFDYEEREIAFDEAFLRSLKDRPEIRQYEAQGEQAKSSVAIAKADTRPSVYASWDYYSSSLTSLTFSPSKAWQDYNIVGLTFSWPVFDGWAAKAKVEQAVADLKSARILKEKAASDIALELKNAYLDLKNAILSIRSAESEAVLYQDSLSVIKEKYAKALVSLLDLEDASLRLDVSLYNKKQAVYDYLVAKARFDKAAGGM